MYLVHVWMHRVQAFVQQLEVAKGKALHISRQHQLDTLQVWIQREWHMTKRQYVMS